MAEIRLLDDKTIDQIAAGEVVERPSSVVKELVENAMDAGATAITVEIRDGGISFIRVTDNGSGIPKDQVKKAFLRHATSKIAGVEDLDRISSLGFRGEALSSISAVAMVELITKTKEELTGIRYTMEGEREQDFSEIGAPEGTTIIVRELFFNTPARRKFLKTPATEGSYIGDLMEHLALSRPDISFQFIQNKNVRFQTSGSGDLKEVIYRIYGRETVSEMFPFSARMEGFKVSGYLGTPVLVKANRNFEFFFVNGRYIKSTLLSKALEEGYRAYLMQHKFPCAVLQFEIDTAQVDVNVHPSKMEIRFHDSMSIFQFLEKNIKDALKSREMIPEAVFEEKPVTFEKPAITESSATFQKPVTTERSATPEKKVFQSVSLQKIPPQPFETRQFAEKVAEERKVYEEDIKVSKSEQMTLFEDRVFSKEAVSGYEIIGQVFDTYWLMSYEGKLVFIDQHAAHEKIKYERLLKRVREGHPDSQLLAPPEIVTLSGAEIGLLTEYMDYFEQLGFEIEEFGGNSYAVRAVPCDLYGQCGGQFLQNILNELAESAGARTSQAVLEKLASMACKSAVKGNHRMSREEMEELLNQLLTLENPYHCPHGRPTMITMTKQELEKKFKRIV